MSSLDFIIKDFTIATIYDKLQRIDLGVSKSTNINTIIKNGEAFGIKQLSLFTFVLCGVVPRPPTGASPLDPTEEFPSSEPLFRGVQKSSNDLHHMHLHTGG